MYINMMFRRIFLSSWDTVKQIRCNAINLWKEGKEFTLIGLYWLERSLGRRNSMKYRTMDLNSLKCCYTPLNEMFPHCVPYTRKTLIDHFVEESPLPCSIIHKQHD